MKPFIIWLTFTLPSIKCAVSSICIGKMYYLKKVVSKQSNLKIWTDGLWQRSGEKERDRESGSWYGLLFRTQSENIGHCLAMCPGHQGWAIQDGGRPPWNIWHFVFNRVCEELEIYLLTHYNNHKVYME